VVSTTSSEGFLVKSGIHLCCYSIYWYHLVILSMVL